jgi:regulator of sigma E protease
MEIIFKILQFILSFSLLIIVHELGHFLFARMFGIRVERFQLFFGKPWVSIKRGDTTYGIGWVPFGGYVTLSGMIDESMNTAQMKQEPQPWEFRTKPAWQRLLTMTGGVIMNLVMAYAIFVGMSYAWGDAYLSTRDVKHGYVFSDGAKQLGFEDGDRIVSVNGEEFEDVDELTKALVFESGGHVKVIRNGAEVDIVMPTVSVKELFKSPDLLTPRYPFVVAEIVEGAGAQAAGLMPGDRLVSLAGQPMIYFDQYQKELQNRKGDTAQIGIERDSATMTLSKVFEVKISAQGTMGAKIDLLAVTPLHTREYTLLQSFPAGFHKVGAEISAYWKQLKMLVNPKTEAYKSISSPLGIGNIFPGEWDWYAFWRITALLSVVLAIMNILPIPALDGGHVLFVLVEMLSGRKPSDKFIVYAQGAGMALLLLIMIYALGNDVRTLFGK